MEKYTNNSNVPPYLRNTTRTSIQNQEASRFQSFDRPQRRSDYNQDEMIKLDELLGKNPEDIILFFMKPNVRIVDYLNSPTMTDTVIYKLALVLNKAFECNSIQTVMQQQIESIIESVYFKRHLYEAIAKTTMNSSYNFELIELTIKICCRFLFLQPKSQPKLVSFKDRIELFMAKKAFPPNIKDWFDILVREDKEANNKNRFAQKRGFPILADCSGIEPPEDFTELNVVPTLTDIISEHTSQFLRKNITNGAYQSVSHYLDVQFRLLREDFLQPLRDGVQKFRHIIQEARFNNRLITRKNEQDQLTNEVTKSICNIDSLSVYLDCSIKDSVPSEYGIVYQVQLSKEKAKSIYWNSSKKLLFGSLVCLSNDFFENTCLIGSICERDKTKLIKGIVTVKFNLDAETQLKLDQIEFGANFIILETSAFFESYKHVLKALVSFRHNGEENFPFRENLVYCQNKSMQIPRYLSNVQFDLSTFLNENSGIEFESSLTECYASSPEGWPSAAQMGFDPSQYEAVKLVLQNKLALIQGPPGTGKTFIGVKIVHFLMNNKRLWWNRPGDRRRPILMVCYTNHALDQFLENCIKQCGLTDGVVRVGGQSRSTNLDEFKLTNIKSDKRKLNRRLKLDDNIHSRVANQREELTFLRDQINHISLGIK